MKNFPLSPFSELECDPVLKASDFGVMIKFEESVVFKLDVATLSFYNARCHTIYDNPVFPAQFKGKKIYDDSGKFTSVAVVKGGAEKGDVHAVDGISGATSTRNPSWY